MFMCGSAWVAWCVRWVWLAGQPHTPHTPRGGAATTGPDATHPPGICQNPGGGGGHIQGLGPAAPPGHTPCKPHQQTSCATGRQGLCNRTPSATHAHTKTVKGGLFLAHRQSLSNVVLSARPTPTHPPFLPSRPPSRISTPQNRTSKSDPKAAILHIFRLTQPSNRPEFYQNLFFGTPHPKNRRWGTPPNAPKCPPGSGGGGGGGGGGRKNNVADRSLGGKATDAVYSPPDPPPPPPNGTTS